MIIDIEKILIILFLSIIIYIIHSKFFNIYQNNFEPHQKYSTNIIANPIGGYTILLFIFLFNFYSNYLELFFLICIFLLGVLSDNKLFNSPKFRLIIQILIILIFLSFSEIEILSTRIDFFDNLLKNNFINILFTAFCILIVINGSNFIDGLNGLVIGYYSIIIIVLLNTDINFNLYLSEHLLNNFLFMLAILLIVNFLNKIFLGDNGSYLIGFLFSVYLIKIYQINSNISPYFIILLLWYPCFENLFSIIRKNILKKSAIMADSKHLHQLLFLFLSNKFNINNKIIANNLTSIILNMYNLTVFFVALQNIYKTNFQVFLIMINLTVYILVYFLLTQYKNNKKI